MYSQHPEMAERWEKETPEGKLPEKVKKASWDLDWDSEIDRLLSGTGLNPDIVKLACSEEMEKIAGAPGGLMMGAGKLVSRVGGFLKGAPGNLGRTLQAGRTNLGIGAQRLWNLPKMWKTEFTLGRATAGSAGAKQALGKQLGNLTPAQITQFSERSAARKAAQEAAEKASREGAEQATKATQEASEQATKATKGLAETAATKEAPFLERHLGLTTGAEKGMFGGQKIPDWFKNLSGEQQAKWLGVGIGGGMAGGTALGSAVSGGPGRNVQVYTA